MEEIVKVSRGVLLATAIAAGLAGCSKSSTGEGSAAAAESAASPSAGMVAGGATTLSASQRSAGALSAGSTVPSGGNTAAGRELVNPDPSTVVFLYYQLAHLTPPIDTWVEEDNRVKFAPALEKAAKREAVRAELNAAVGSVQGVGALRLTMNANLSDYDPSYGEFTVRALSPSSVVNFDALGQKVAVNFTNGRTAQIWRVPQAEAQGVRDKITSSSVEMDVLLRIANVLPGPGGGTIATDVVEYELREAQRGSVLARVKLQEQK